MKHYKVVIVGAGVSGCKAAQTLVLNGITDVVILEATDSIGGRAKTVKTPYGNFEHGAQWIHGNEGNPLYDELDKHNLIGYKGEHLYDDEYVDNMQFFGPHGKSLDRSTVINGFTVYDDVSDRIEDHWKPNQSSIEEFKTEQFEKICALLNVTPKERKIYEAITMFEDKAQGYSEAIYPNDRSHLINHGIFNDCGGKNFVFLKGTFSIIEQLLLPTIQDKIMLNTEVKKVEWAQDDQIYISTSTDVISAEYVIMTPSLGFLKKNHTKLFLPQLPPNKSEAIENLTFGRAEKFCFMFDEPFWMAVLMDNPEFSGFGFVYHEEDISDLTEHMATILGREATWWKEIACLTTCSMNPNLLILWLAGDPCIEASRCSDDMLKRVVFALLEYFAGITVTQPCTLIRTNWCSNKYFLGSWSTIEKGYETRYTKAMIEPLYHGDKPALMLAGEVCHNRLMSTLQGAYCSGENQAMKIVDYERTSKSRSPSM